VAKPQLEHGYVRLASELVTAFARLHLSCNEWQVLWVIIRRTYGFHKKDAHISNRLISDATGLHKTVVSRILRKLTDGHIIYYNGRRIGLQKDWEQWPLVIQTELQIQKLAELPTFKAEISPVEKPPKDPPNPDVSKILLWLEEQIGNPLPHYPQNGAEIKAALKMGFTADEFMGCWLKLKTFDFWKGKWLPLSQVTNNLGDFRKGVLSDGKTRRRVEGTHTAADYENSWGGPG